MGSEMCIRDRIYGNDPTAATAVLSMAFVIVIYRIESISINSEKEEKI